jgi:RNA polymerase sigma factor (sigma-70 family)
MIAEYRAAMADDAYTAITKAREEFLGIVETIRPELHRYCARLTGSVIEGEDIVQDTLAKAFYALGLTAELPPLRPWLFRIAHNAALDFLKSHGKKLTDPRADMTDVAGVDESPDPFATRVALARFMTLPVIQRSAVILKDVLGHSLEETAETMATTVMAVKAALVRGRTRLREAEDTATPAQLEARAELDRYVTLFNAGDWDGVRALIGEDCRLDVVSRSHRRGKAVGLYFSRYEARRPTLRVVLLDGELALAATAPSADVPSYFILLDWHDGRVTSIRDFHYVPYIAAEATFVEV